MLLLRKIKSTVSNTTSKKTSKQELFSSRNPSCRNTPSQHNAPPLRYCTENVRLFNPAVIARTMYIIQQIPLVCECECEWECEFECVCYCECACGCECERVSRIRAAGRCGGGGLRIARARRDLSNAHRRVKIHAGLSKSMWRGRGGPQSRGRAVPSGSGITALVCGSACAGS